MLFSIIIPTYNRADRIRETINSVLNQTYINWECIIIDDGGTDNTSEAVNQIGDERIRYIYKEHGERSAARNLGIKESKGQYICFLDSDDGFKPEHLSTLETAIRSQQKPKLFQTGWVIQQVGEEVQYLQKQPSNSYKYLWFTGVPINAFCFDKEVLQLEAFPVEFWVWEDRHLMFRVMEHRKLHIIEAATAIFVEHSGRFMNNADPNVLMERIEQMPSAIDDLISTNGEDLLKHISIYDIKRKKSGVLQVYAQDAIRAGEVNVAKVALTKAGSYLVLRSFPRWIVLKTIVSFWPLFKVFFK